MLKCLYLRHLNALEHREYGIALDTLHQYFDYALLHGPFPSHRGSTKGYLSPGTGKYQPFRYYFIDFVFH